MKRIVWIRTLIVGMVALAVVGTGTALLRLPVFHSSASTTPSALMKHGSTGSASNAGSVGTAGATATAGASTLSSTTLNVSSNTPSMPTATPKPAMLMPTAAANTGNTATASDPFSLIYSDDFNGSQLNPAWGTYNGPHVGGQSYYSPGEVQVQNGLLNIWIEHKTTGGQPYTSGGVGAFRLAQTYGKYEFSAKLPLGKGINPYTILWPQTATSNVEVDISESPPALKNEVYFTNHGGPGGTSSGLTSMGNFAAGFHTYTCEWTPDMLRFLIDGVLVGTITKNVPNQPMWFGIAMSSGDAFTGLPDSSTVFPADFQIDWVHIYKYTG